jgi:hypothetical protein
MLVCTVAGATACGSVDGVDNPGEPIVTVVARLDMAPADMPDDHLRATLVWLNGPPFGGARCEDGRCEGVGREYTVLTTSDVAVETEFPLTVRLGMFELPNPIAAEYPGAVQTSDGRLHLIYNSLPEAEVVLYEDSNHNGRLDLLPPGQPGPGPDRIVALSSGRDEQGTAVRTIVVNKRSPVPAGFANDPSSPALAVFAFPLPKELTDLGWPTTPNRDALFLPPDAPLPPVYDDGVYALKLTAPASMSAVQHELLTSHNLVGEPNTYEGDLMAAAIETVEPIAGAVVRLFPVTAERKSWLARGCNPFDQHTNTKLSPPPGAEVQCGAGALRYALNPDDYCGLTRVVDNTWPEPLSEPAWWPCDAQGLKAGAPFRAAQKAIDDPLINPSSNIVEYFFPDAVPLDCSGGRIEHYDLNPGLRLPSAAPPSGSQIMCYGPDALSFIPARGDGCRIKYTYELTSTGIAGLPNDMSWDLTGSRPSWWPCDAQGQLRTDTAYVAANTQPATSCRTSLHVQFPRRALPGHARVRCESATELSYAPLWSDGCEPVRYSTHNVVPPVDWEIETPSWWPCDTKGSFISGKGYLPW